MDHRTQTHRVGIVLSGGGIRGAAHVGVLEALADQAVAPTALAGASAGSFAAAMYATGMTTEAMLDAFRASDVFSWSYFGLPRKAGLLDSEALLKVLYNVFGEKTFADTGHRELHIVATDLLKGKPHFFGVGPLALAVMASSAFPGLISPVEHQGCVFIDGGVLNNLPVEPLVGRCEILIGVHANPIPEATPEQVDGPIAVAQRAFQLSTHVGLEARLPSCDFVIEPEGLIEIGMFEHARTDEAFRIGYEAALPVAREVAQRLGR